MLKEGIGIDCEYGDGEPSKRKSLTFACVYCMTSLERKPDA